MRSQIDLSASHSRANKAIGRTLTWLDACLAAQQKQQQQQQQSDISQSAAAASASSASSSSVASSSSSSLSSSSSSNPHFSLLTDSSSTSSSSSSSARETISRPPQPLLFASLPGGGYADLRAKAAQEVAKRKGVQGNERTVRPRPCVRVPASAHACVRTERMKHWQSRCASRRPCVCVVARAFAPTCVSDRISILFILVSLFLRLLRPKAWW